MSCRPRSRQVHDVSPSTLLLPATVTIVASSTTPEREPARPAGHRPDPRVTTGPYAERSLPSGTYELQDVAIASGGATSITAESAGILELSPAANTVLFPNLPSGSTSLRAAVDPAGRTSSTEAWQDKIGRLNPDRGEVVEWSVATGAAAMTASPILPEVTERVAPPIRATRGPSAFLLQIKASAGQIPAGYAPLRGHPGAYAPPSRRQTKGSGARRGAPSATSRTKR